MLKQIYLSFRINDIPLIPTYFTSLYNYDDKIRKSLCLCWLIIEINIVYGNKSQSNEH